VRDNAIADCEACLRCFVGGAEAHRQPRVLDRPGFRRNWPVPALSRTTDAPVPDSGGEQLMRRLVEAVNWVPRCWSGSSWLSW